MIKSRLQHTGQRHQQKQYLQMITSKSIYLLVLDSTFPGKQIPPFVLSSWWLYKLVFISHVHQLLHFPSCLKLATYFFVFESALSLFFSLVQISGLVFNSKHSLNNPEFDDMLVVHFVDECEGVNICHKSYTLAVAQLLRQLSSSLVINNLLKSVIKDEL